MNSRGLSTPGKESAAELNGFLTDSSEAGNPRMLNSSLQAGRRLGGGGGDRVSEDRAPG